MLGSALLPLVVLAGLAAAYGVHEDQETIAEGGDWAEAHMAYEHHISSFDSASFFSLHDYSSMGRWDADDILKTYGLKDRSKAHVSQEERTKVIEAVLNIYDTNHDNYVSRDEFTSKFDAGERLPDFGFGPGQHGDDEYEYDIHHFEKYHDENTKEEDLIHPEDIEHFKHHDEMDALQDELDRIEAAPRGVQEKNIPAKFKRKLRSS